MRIQFFSALALALALITMTACETAPKSAEGRANIQDRANAARATAQASDSSLGQCLAGSAGYAVFPTVGKGAVGVGGAYGKGVLYENGMAIGYCDLKQATVGVQLGGQSYTEIICFENGDALNRFKSGNYAFDAQASAVALKSGAGANAKYANGVAVFTMNESGLMYEAAVGGQKFDYQPK